MTRLVPILRCVKNRASRDVSGADVAKSSPTDSIPARTTSRTLPLNSFFHFTLRALESLSPDIKTRDTQRPTRRRWARSTWDQCQAHHNVFVLPLLLRLFEKLQSHENRDTTTAKWTRIFETGPQSRVRSSCRREHILPAPFWDARLVRPFSMARRNYESSRRGRRGVLGEGPDAGVLTAAVHDEVSRSRFLEKRVSSRSVREERTSSSRVSRRMVMERRSGRTQP